MTGRNKRMRGRLTAVFLTSSLFLAGCKGGLPISSSAQGEPAYSESQILLIAATEMNRYEQAYTDQIWDVVLENGQTFEVYLLQQVQVFLKDLRVMNLLAENQDIDVSSAEKERVRQVAERYYSGLSQTDIAYLGITQEDVTAMYEEYYRANKVVETLTKDIDLEVSDSEAKVIVIHQAEFADGAAADGFYEQAAAEGADFAALAKESGGTFSENRSLGRGEEEKTLEDAAFALTAGQVSPVVESGGVFYVMQCVNEYDVEATAKRKTQIYNERKNQVFEQIYTQFQKDEEIVFSDEIWPEITVPAGGISVGNFFTLYQEEFGSQS